MAKSSRHDSRGTPAIRSLEKAQIRFTLHSYVHDPTTTDFGREAAEKLDVAADRIFKTLVVDLGGSLAVAVVPVNSRMSLPAVASAFDAKRARLADPSIAEKKTGYVIGGISPIGQKAPLPTVIDASCRAHTTVFVSAGRRGLDIEITPDDLRAATGGSTAQLI